MSNFNKKIKQIKPRKTDFPQFYTDGSYYYKFSWCGKYIRFQSTAGIFCDINKNTYLSIVSAPIMTRIPIHEAVLISEFDNLYGPEDQAVNKDLSLSA